MGIEAIREGSLELKKVSVWRPIEEAEEVLRFAMTSDHFEMTGPLLLLLLLLLLL
jgi:hypothetical protein